MKTVARLAELEAKCRTQGLTRDEMREANRLRARARENKARQRRYQSDPEYRQTMQRRALAYFQASRRMEAAE